MFTNEIERTLIGTFDSGESVPEKQQVKRRRQMHQDRLNKHLPLGEVSGTIFPI